MDATHARRRRRVQPPLGVVVVLLPGPTLTLLGFDGDDAYQRSLWGCIGMIVGVYGVGYAVAARQPLHHWPIVLVGLLGKIFGPLGFLMALPRGDVPPRMGWTLLTNDLIWWVPFALILWAAWRRDADGSQRSPTADRLRRYIQK